MNIFDPVIIKKITKYRKAVSFQGKWENVTNFLKKLPGGFFLDFGIILNGIITGKAWNLFWKRPK